VLANASIELRDCNDETARSILEWPEEFVASLRKRLLDLRAGCPQSAADLAALQTHGVLNAGTGKPTGLGQYLIDLVMREEVQQQDYFMSVICQHADRVSRGVLDVGCGTGWMMRSLDLGQTNDRVGIDIDALALALGYRFARIEGQECSFRYCSAQSLPFPDGSFDLVLCRNALTYMHQRTALREFCRVLRPGGLVFIRFENVWYDLLRVLRPASGRALCFNTRDFLWGLFHAMIGRQPVPGGRIPGARAFGTLGRLTKILRTNGCEVILSEAHPNALHFMGRATQSSLLARKTALQPLPA
jgi:SAM-dependent methyltransferase